MKLILQILLSLFMIFFTNISEMVSCETFNGSGVTELIFYQANSEYQQAFISFENTANKSCLNGKVVVTYSEQVTGKDRNAAKGGTLRFGKNFSSKLSSNTTLNSAEKSIAKEVHEILNSSEFEKIVNAHSTKKTVQIEINGRTISYDDAPFSGMTWFEKNGFNIGREAFSSDEELIKTVLHEMHRLETSTLRGTGTVLS